MRGRSQKKGRSGELGGLDDALADEFGLGALDAFEDVVDLLWCVEGVGLDAGSFAACAGACPASVGLFLLNFFHN